MTTRFIAVDWGSTNFRAWRYEEDRCLESRTSEAGITRLNGAAPEAVLREIVKDWLTPEVPVVMAGMVGSNAGWQVAPYLACPARLSAIGENLTQVKENIWIVPGLSVSQQDNHNVMRGEETQLAGARQLAPASLYILPGTHCKWVWADEETVQDFRTQITGELHYLLLQHSLIGAGLPAQTLSPQAFQKGLMTGLNDPAILPRLFEIRAAWLLGALPREQVSEFLSGILIGSEVNLIARQASSDTITLVANSTLTERYQLALRATGREARQLSGDEAFQTGIRSIVHAMAS